MFVDFIQNGRGHGAVGETFQGARFDAGLLRPYKDSDGRVYMTVNTGRMKTVKDDKGKIRTVPEFKKVPIQELQRRGIQSPVMNANLFLRKDQWIQMDAVVSRVQRQRLRAWEDLKSASSVSGFNGMSKMTYEYQAMSDTGEALVDMDGMTDGRNDAPLFALRSIPLPITHADFWFSSRQLAVANNSDTPLDTTMQENCVRRIAEMIEKTLIGVETGIQYGPTASSDTRYDNTSKIYGYTNFPSRNTKTDLNTPTGANPEAVMRDVIEMREQLYSDNFYGPYILYHTPAYDAFFDDDYFRAGSTAEAKTLRERIKAIDGIMDVRRLDYWTGSTYQMVMVQMTPEVVQAINGMDITTVQWESQGGMRLNFKVMAIQVPLLKSDYTGQCGILHATTS